jgi:hypothetical protein
MLCIEGRMARGGYGVHSMDSPNTSSIARALYALPFSSYERPPLKRPYSRFKGGHPQDGRPAVIFYPFGHPTRYAYDCISMIKR